MTQTKNLMKARLVMLGLTQCDLVPMVQERLPQYRITPSVISLSVNCVEDSPRSDKIRKTIGEILDEMEQKGK